MKGTSPDDGSMTSEVACLGDGAFVNELIGVGAPRRYRRRPCEDMARSANTPTKTARAIHVEP